MGERWSMKSPGGRLSKRTMWIGVGVTLLLLAGCAPEPAGHLDDTFASGAGIELLEKSTAPVSAAAETVAAPHLGVQLEPSVPLRSGSAPLVIDQDELQLVPLRLRNDAVGLAARFVAVPGVPEFSERVHQLIRAAIDTAAVPYTPQVFDTNAGLANRGCVPESLLWSAAEVLQHPETAPPGSSGIAITCEVVSASGDTLLIAFRTVTGTPAEVRGDERLHFTVNVATGEIAEGISRWHDGAAAEFWEAAAADLGAATPEEPSPAQLEHVRTALEVAPLTTDGGVLVRMPDELLAQAGRPEAANVPAQDEATFAHVSPELVQSWSTAAHALPVDGSPLPFSGITARPDALPVDCELMPCVAVTYDDGPGPHTPSLLAQLREHGARATFYMLGQEALKSPDVVRQVAREGHELGSHSMDHAELTLIDVAAARAQVHDSAQVLRELTGEPIHTYRPPYGSVSAEVQAAVNMPAIIWNIDTNDWQRPGPAELVARSVPVAQPGSIILFHDIHPDSVAVAGQVFAGLHDRGFVTVTVSQLFGGTVPNEILRSR